MRALVTGSSGRIGAAVVRALPVTERVIGVDRVPGPHTTHEDDLGDSSRLRQRLSGVDVVFHLAALHAPHVAQRGAAEFKRVNVEATARLLDAARAARVPRFVFTSTTSVYGCTTRAADRAVWVTEELPPNPEDIYDETKLAAEEMCRQAAGRDFTAVVLRVSRCFPEPPHLLAFYRLYRGLDLRDAARAHVLAAGAPLEPCSVFNVSADTPFRPEDAEALWGDPWGIIDRGVPGLARTFEERGWPRPPRVDRVYVTAKANVALGYRSEHGVLAVLRGDTP
jgi:nucleoside-diphosphate-sugar epimerase